MSAKHNLNYHIVLVPKYRNRCFSGIEQSVLQAFNEAEQKSSFTIKKIAVEDGDHVHLVLQTSGTYALSKTIARIKSFTAHCLWSKHPEHLKKFYWTGNKKLWSGGYYAATLGDVSIEQVGKYLQKQGHWK